MSHCLRRRTGFGRLTGLAVGLLAISAGLPEARADLPPFDKVSSGYEEIEVSDQQAKKGLFKVWKNSEQQLLGELPKNFASKRYFLALTVSAGDRYAGLQAGDWVVQWRRYNDRLALIAPNLSIKATGEPEAKASVERLFTDQVLLDVPIMAMGPSGGPVIDLDALLVGNATRFFGSQVRVTNPRLVEIDKAKVFKDNIELAFEIVGSGNRLQKLHYSISEVPSISSGYKPRKADERVGYFTTTYSDLSKYVDDETRVRFINRWRLEKRDPKLKLSPPKEPIRFYIEHTTPVRYRRWVKEGVEYWNKAFEKIGIIDAIVVEYQDAATGAHMEKDPEDVNYNFIRWLNNDIGTAIGPSRVHPETGEILDADIILTDGWIRHFNFNYHDLMPQLAMDGMSPETLAWLAKNPNWDPRVRYALPSDVAKRRAETAYQASQPLAGHALGSADPMLIGDDEYDGLYGRISQRNGYCMAAEGRSLDLAIARMSWELALMEDKAAEAKKKKKKKKGKKKKKQEDDDKEEGSEDKKSEDDSDDKEEEKEDSDAQDDDDQEGDAEGSDDEAKDEDKPEESLVDGMPEWFVGPLLADLVCHEVGHTLGLRHNFKASAVYTLDEINSEEIKGQKTFSSSVMDYIPINFRYEAGEVQGDYGMIGIGPYDFWAIEYGYTLSEGDLPKILSRCSEPELQYATDEDTVGPDPLARRYDFSKDPLDFAEEQMKLVELYRDRILDKFVKDGETWNRARRGYELTLGIQQKSISMMANWVGGAFINRDKKGDPGDRNPVEVVPVEQQRAALDFVIRQAFEDDAFGLTPELLARMPADFWMESSPRGSISAEGTWPVHDRILDIQASALTSLMNPTTLRRVYDNELRVPGEADMLTLPEMLDKIGSAVWTELDGDCPEKRNDRQPMISSLRRNLQREHSQRLLDLVLKESAGTAAYKPITTLARAELRELQGKIRETMERCRGKMDAYTAAHLSELDERIGSALKASYVYNGGQAGGNPMIFRLGSGIDEDAATVVRPQ